METEKKKKGSINKKKLILDVFMTVAFMLAMEPRFTGLTLHEWLGIGGWFGVTLHLILNWKWIVRTTEQFFSKMNGRRRLYYILDTLLFASFTVMNISGLIISRTFDTAMRLGLSPDTALFWRDAHFVSADLCLIIIALHVALHWKWIVNMFKKFVFRKDNRVSRKVASRATLVSRGIGR